MYKVEEIMREVRVCLDQNMTSEALLADGDSDTLALDEVIRSKIVEGVVRVESKAAARYLEAGHNLEDVVFWGDQESGWVLLPHDFMRLITFRMSDWERTVYKAITPDDARYALQRQRVKALRGTAQKPVCVIVNRPEGKALEFYSCKSEDAYMAEGTYLPYPEIDRDGSIDISERCHRAVIYEVASLVLMTYGEVDKASTLTELAKSMFTFKPN